MSRKKCSLPTLTTPSLPWSAVKKRNQAIPGPARTGLLTAAGLRPSALSPELPGAEQSGENVQIKPRSHLYHDVQPQWSWMSQRKPEGTVQCLSSCKQIHPSLANFSNCASSPQCEAVIPPGLSPCLDRMSVPKLDAQECGLLSVRGVRPGTTQGSGTLVCTNGVSADLLGG